jgi:hypothetical protein
MSGLNYHTTWVSLKPGEMIQAKYADAVDGTKVHICCYPEGCSETNARLDLLLHLDQAKVLRDNLNEAIGETEDPAEMLRLAIDLVERVAGKDEDEGVSGGSTEKIDRALMWLKNVLGFVTDTRSEAERRADYEADRADDKISSGEVEGLHGSLAKYNVKVEPCHE